MRNLDLTTLRSFVAVADQGGVTRAAGHLNLTQSAVSMQLKRLEEMLGIELLDRSNRRIGLTPSGDQLLGYARRLVAINDEIVSRLSDQKFEGEVILGVPHDIVYPVIPPVLQRFNAEYPRVKVRLVSCFTRALKVDFAMGDADLILTTEAGLDNGGETLHELPLRWFGAIGGSGWRQRPLRLAFCRNCTFRGGAQAALDAADIPWEMAVDTDSDRTIEATVSADLAITAMLEGTGSRYFQQIDAQAVGDDLPQLPAQLINLYTRQDGQSEPLTRLAEMLREAIARW